MHMRPQNRSALIHDASQQIARQIDIAARTIVAANSGKRTLLYFIRPSRAQIEEAARQRVPSESRLAIAAATMRPVSISVAPGDVPDVAGVFNDGIVLWVRGTLHPARPYRITRYGSSGALAFHIGRDRPLFVTNEQFADAAGRPLSMSRMAELIRPGQD